ncbi:glycoside hydrolase family 15 protein [Methylobacterium sp. J-077]|uniref:glycoside hydrolase family 15 protein n=1 Tax=Methylobacterium sp. J-077 TaxID=2836656 RepID=UPI001FB8B802|nr:glycoside hydrolase family 15 protein [Methylobacterium sp. J-077]MCJ2124958.1 glycoside hydrolase family 15 protein [Methylobacterium sp. J-077]
MSTRIEDYALVGDCRSAALISRDGSVDWLCWPRFDAAALFARLLGTREHGFWKICPAAGEVETTWTYREGSLVLETRHKTSCGEVLVTDFMPVGEGSHLVRLVEGVHGQVDMQMELSVRFDYGSAVPWVTRSELGDLRAVVGPHKVVLRTDVPVHGSQSLTTVADFAVHAGESRRFVLSYCASYLPDPAPVEPRASLDATDQVWRGWSQRCATGTAADRMLQRSLLTLKALIYQPTGGIVAAPTASLPEGLGGERNWDYRFCWIRDSTLTLIALMDGGYIDEARDWLAWLLRSIAGNPEQAQILYGIAGERQLPEVELDWLPGYEDSKPVRIGNAAAGQFQLDVYGELFDALYQAHVRGLPISEDGLKVGLAILHHLETAWREPDDGIWEVRGGRRHFTHSKVMAWVAFDRALRMHELTGLATTAEQAVRWRQTRDEIHAEVCEKGFDAELGSFVQSFGSEALDASLLLIAHTGFLPQDDPRVVGTVDAVGKGLMRDGFILRYETEGQATDGLSGNEGAFLPCTFWYVDNLIGLGRHAEAETVIDRLIGVFNDLGLVSEEYDVKRKRLVGNYPQAFTHVALVNTLLNHARSEGPAARHGRKTPPGQVPTEGASIGDPTAVAGRRAL